MSNPNLDTEVEQQVYLAARRVLGDDVPFDSQLEEQVYNALVEAGVGGGGGGGGSSPLPSNTVPYAPGTAAVGTSSRYARADHVHPLQDSAAKLTTARNLAVSDYDASHTGVATSFDGSANESLKMPSTFKGTLKGNADTSTKLATARKLKVDLAAVADATFDGSAAQESIPATGVLPVVHGGTGVTAVVDIQAGKDVDGNPIKTTYAPIASPTFTGTPKAPTANKTTDNTQIATTAFVHDVVEDAMALADVMVFKGGVSAASDLPTLPDVVNGWSYKATQNFTLGDVSVIAGALIVAKVTGTPEVLTWEVFQTNADGSVFGPASSVDGDIVLFDGTSGNSIADSGLSVATTLADDATSIPTSKAVYDALPDPYTGTAPISVDATTHEISIDAATQSAAGSMSAADKTKLDGIEDMTGATALADGAHGLVPQPDAGEQAKYLRGDGTWATPDGATYTASAPIAIDASNDISVADATDSSKGVVQIGDNVSVNNGTISVKPWTYHVANHSSVDPATLQNWAIIETDEPVGGSPDAVLAEVEQTVSGSSLKVPSSAAAVAAFPEKVTDIYVDGTNGADTNDGKTAATAVATIAKGLEIARGVHPLANIGVYVHIADGTYNETVSIGGQSVALAINSAVTVTSIACSSSASVNITADSANATLTITGRLAVNSTAYCWIDSKIALSVGNIETDTNGCLLIRCSSTTLAPNDTHGIKAYSGSEIHISNAVSITMSSDNHAVYVGESSSVTMGNNLTVSGTLHTAVFVIKCSSVVIAGNILSTSFSGGRIVYANRCSSVQVNGNIAVSNASLTTYAIHAIRSSNLSIDGTVDISGDVSTNRFVNADDSASINIGGKLTINLGSDTITGLDVIVSARCSSVSLASGAEVTAAPTIRSVLWAVAAGYLYTSTIIFNGTVSIGVARSTLRGFIEVAGSNGSGTATGKKYNCETGGSIGGVAKLPGSTAGTADAATFCFAS